jgi:hypothetical protein
VTQLLFHGALEFVRRALYLVFDTVFHQMLLCGGKITIGPAAT